MLRRIVGKRGPLFAIRHTIGFRQSQQYQEWKQLLHHFYEPFPTVEHYELVPTNGAIVAQHIIPPDAAR